MHGWSRSGDSGAKNRGAGILILGVPRYNPHPQKPRVRHPNAVEQLQRQPSIDVLAQKLCSMSFQFRGRLSLAS
jgi:hypothetical protein